MTTTRPKARFREGSVVVRVLAAVCRLCGERLCTYRNGQGMEFTTCPTIMVGGGFHPQEG